MSVEAPQLFNVNGLVALVTGGGTGTHLLCLAFFQFYIQRS